MDSISGTSALRFREPPSTLEMRTEIFRAEYFKLPPSAIDASRMLAGVRGMSRQEKRVATQIETFARGPNATSTASSGDTVRVTTVATGGDSHEKFARRVVSSRRDRGADSSEPRAFATAINHAYAPLNGVTPEGRAV